MTRATHEVTNQPPPLVDVNLFETDPALIEAVHRYCAAWADGQLRGFGAAMGSEDLLKAGFQANEYPPVLQTHDRFGRRRDMVEFHPSWHSLMSIGVANGLHSSPWKDPKGGAHVARAALMMLAGQNEAGHLCPLSMTYSSIPVLKSEPVLIEEWEPNLFSLCYDPRFRPHHEKGAALIGMGMTEKQGGSDVRANTTRAESAGPQGEYLLTGHKWFCSAPMSDAFLVLAQAPRGLTCFFLPRWTPEGEVNGIQIQRLKPKLGNRSNASSEVEFDRAWARRMGEEGRGVSSIMEMVQHTRLDCCLGAAALMRRALIEAIHHTRGRSAFGRLLAEQPLMQSVLADLAIESEAATSLAMRLARAFDRRSADPSEHAFARLATAASKYWICKRVTAHTAEALECLGGGGYVEESILPRLYREAPLNGIWEGSGNVIALDVLRAIRKEPETVEALLEEVRSAKGADSNFDAALTDLEQRLHEKTDEAEARSLAELIATVLAGSLLLRHAPGPVASLYCGTRLRGMRRFTFGTHDLGGDASPIIVRAWPV